MKDRLLLRCAKDNQLLQLGRLQIGRGVAVCGCCATARQTYMRRAVSTQETTAENVQKCTGFFLSGVTRK